MNTDKNISKLPAKLQQNEYLKIYIENKIIKKSESHLASLAGLVLNNIRVRQHHIEALQSALQEFQADITPFIRSFDVYDFVGKCTGHSGFTVRKWLNENDDSGTKLGTEDFLAICHVIDNIRPADILFYDAQNLCTSHEPLRTEIPIRELTDTMLKVLNGSGKFIEKFTEEFSDAAKDGVVDMDEKERLCRHIFDHIGILQSFLTKLEVKDLG